MWLGRRPESSYLAACHVHHEAQLEVVEMEDLPRINRSVTKRSCPGCDFIVSQLEIELMHFNFKCPRCGEHAMSSFTPWPRPTPDPSRPSRKKIA